MYNAPSPSVPALWQALANHLVQSGLVNVPAQLSWPLDLHAHWQEPTLLLSQACGYPLMTFLAGKVQVVGGFHYSAPGCEGVTCKSQFIARLSDNLANTQGLEYFRSKAIAFNDTNSQSGYNALRAAIAPLAIDGEFFGQRLRSGSHRQSIEMVQSGQADLASIDCVTLAGFKTSQPQLLEGIVVVGESASYPGLPLITSLATTPDEMLRLRQALNDVTQDPHLAEICRSLFINKFEALDVTRYQTILEMEQAALKAGYPLL
jgi:ABC-type phosphate/phosphonate transport system substrate-binding protein